MVRWSLCNCVCCMSKDESNKLLGYLLAVFFISAFLGWAFFNVSYALHRQENMIEDLIKGQKILLASVQGLSSENETISKTLKIFEDNQNALNVSIASDVTDLKAELKLLQERLDIFENTISIISELTYSDATAISFLMGAVAPPSAKERTAVSFDDVRPAGIRPVRPRFDGGGGRDTVVSGADEAVIIDGTDIVRVEIYNAANLQPNNIFILAPGLNDLEDDWLHIEADAGLDYVHLDGCLVWKKQKTQKNQQIWQVEDKDKKTRKVTVNLGVDAVISDCDSRYSLKRAMYKMPQDWAYGTEEAYRWLRLHVSKERSQFRRSVRLDEARVKLWLDNLHSHGAKRAFLEIKALLDAQELQYFYPQGVGYLLKALTFDPSRMPLRNASTNVPCEGLQREAVKSGMPMFVYGAGAVLDCEEQGYIIAFEDHEVPSKTVIDNSGFHVFVMGQGDDYIKARPGYSITMLEKNWGHKKIDKACAFHDSGRETVIPMRTVKRQEFGGVGLGLSVKNGTIVVSSFLDPKDEEKLGINQGDVIKYVDGKSVEGLSFLESVNLIRGKVGTTVALGYQRPNETQIQTTKIIRRAIRGGIENAKSSYVSSSYGRDRAPLENLIIFGRGITQKDMQQQEDGVWINKATGDTLRIGSCYGFLFTDGP